MGEGGVNEKENVCFALGGIESAGDNEEKNEENS